MDEITLEEWRSIPGYEGLYEVSSHGRVYTIRRPRVKGGFMKPFASEYGHLSVRLCRDGSGKVWKVHRLVMLAFSGLCPPGQEVRHLDGNPANNRWAPGRTEGEVRTAGGNLFYGTRAQNMADQAEHGTHHLGRRIRCGNGHEFTEENTAIDLRPDGSFKKRRCLTCHRDKSRRWRDLQRESNWSPKQDESDPAA